MPVQQWVERDRRRIRLVAAGELTMDDILKAINGAVEDPAFEPGFDVLSDHRALGEPLTSDQLKQATAHLQNLSQHFAGSRYAVVATTPASYGMMRMFSVLAERIPLKVGVFRSMEEAEAWLASPSSNEAGD
jgi:hypothetical protein